VILSLIRTGLEGPCESTDDAAAKRDRKDHFLPSNIQSAIARFSECVWLREIMGADNHRKFSELKISTSNRCPKELGSRIKTSEIIHHHEVTNQYLWNIF